MSEQCINRHAESESQKVTPRSRPLALVTGEAIVYVTLEKQAETTKEILK